MASASQQAAERRQLTVLFCDIADSTRLFAGLDPEDVRDLFGRYQQRVADVVERHRGTVGKYLGDGLLVYFGFPAAGEDDATRAVRAGLEIVDRVAELSHAVQRERGLQLGVRIGIHTGLVVVGEVGAAGHRILDIVGDPPTIAARLQDLAPTNTVLISADTHRLTSGFFRVRSMGLRELKGLRRPLKVFAVEGETGIRNRLQSTRLSPLVGREAELGTLLGLWDRTKRGESPFVLLSGEAGIGKSRLVVALEEAIGPEAESIALHAAAHGTNTPFAPIVELLQTWMGIESEDSDAARYAKIETYLRSFGFSPSEAAPLLASLLSVEAGGEQAPPSLPPEIQKSRTEELVVDLLWASSERRPVLLTFEDLHWADPSTLHLVGRYLQRRHEGRVFTVFTARPEFVAPWEDHPARIDLPRLDAKGSQELVHAVAGDLPLPPQVVAEILEKTDGIPLYVEEFVAMAIETGALDGTEGTHGEAFGAFAIPATLQDSLMARLDRLNPIKNVVQYASLLGRSFSRRLLERVVEERTADLDLALAQAVASDILHPDGEGYRFKHALIQHAAYESMLRSVRQQRHARVARTLQTHFREIDERQPEVVARHLNEGGLREEAVDAWERAGLRALQGAANVEAVAHLRQALEALSFLPENADRLQRELRLQTALGPGLMATRGYAAPEVERAYARAREICRLLGVREGLFPVLWGLWAFYFVKGDLRISVELAYQLDKMAPSGDATQRLLTAHAVGYNLFWQGKYDECWERVQGGLELYDPATERATALMFQLSPSVALRVLGASTLFMLGRSDASREMGREGIALARELVHPPSLAVALNLVAWSDQIRGDAASVRRLTEENMALSAEQGLGLWLPIATLFHGWSIAQAGEEERGRELMNRGFAGYQATGTGLIRPHLLLVLAERYWKDGAADEALDLLEQGLAQAETTGERHLLPELHRLRGLILAETNDERAERSLRTALEIARGQGASLLVLRAEASLIEYERGRSGDGAVSAEHR